MLARHLEPGKAKHRFKQADYSQNDHCPFGCTRDGGECDERGLCQHFIGVTLQDGERFHAIRNLSYTNKELVRVDMYQDALDGTVEYLVNEQHKLVQITSCFRVYHKDGRASLSKTKKADKKAEKKTPQLVQ